MELPKLQPGRDRPTTIISPSILSADFARLAAEADQMEALGVRWLHVDIMDGHFVPNLTLGPPIIKSLRDATPLYLDCHFMVSNPAQWVAPSAKAGANMYTFHLEAIEGYASSSDTCAPAVTVLCDAVRAAGMHCGIAIKPATPAELLLPYVDAGLVDMVLVMTVEPGFGGQAFMPEMMDKVRTLRRHAPSLNIQVDGGLAPPTIQQAAAAGANVIVAGSAVFGVADRAQAVATLAQAVDDAAAQAA